MSKIFNQFFMGADRLMAIAMGEHTTMDPSNPDKKIETQEGFMQGAAEGVVQDVSKLAVDGYQARVFTHGSGPQTQIIVQRAELSERAGMHPLPLRYASMDLIGSLGMTFQRLFVNALRKHPDGMAALGSKTRGVATVPTSFIIDPNTMQPAKPIGSSLSDEEVVAKRAQGQTVENRDGKGMRVLVPSPRVLSTFPSDLEAIKACVGADLMTIAGGTGGVALEKVGDEFVARDAVIDKDNAMAQVVIDLINRGVEFDIAAVLTDLPVMVKNFAAIRTGFEKVSKEYGGLHKVPAPVLMSVLAAGEPIRQIAVAEMRDLLSRAGETKSVSGGAVPKMRAACDMVDAGVKRAVICGLNNFGGTVVTPGADGVGTTIMKGDRWV